MKEESPVALVTGARKGIGRFLAQYLQEQGYEVIGCSREPSDWKAERYIHIQTDVTDENQVSSLIRKIDKRFGRLYAVINCAGAASMNHAILTPAATLDKLMATNVRGSFLVSREAAKLMRKARCGRIVNISSIAVPMRLEGQAAYVASKGAVELLSQVMSRELAGYGITVNVIGPTPIETDMLRGVPSKKIEQLIQLLSIKRIGTMKDIANVVDFFLRQESDAITGQVLYLGGVIP